MNAIQAIILGIVQALTEFLPVSSSAHVRVFGELMIGKDPGAAFTAIIQLGTELAVLLYFRHDIISILTHWFECLLGKRGTDLKDRFGARDAQARLGWFIIIGTIPIVVVGLLFQKIIETTFRNLWFTVFTLLVFGVLLYVVDQACKQTKTVSTMTTREAVFYGLGQMLALIPGVSRSGGTITVGRAMGYSRQSAVRVSFLMAIPAVFGAGLLQTVKSVGHIAQDPTFPGWGATMIATIISFVLGYVVIIGFLRFVETFSYKAFAIYRIAVAVVVALLLVFNAIPAVG